MILYDIIKKLKNVDADKVENVDVTGVTEDSKEVKPGYIYVARCGEKSDGSKYVDEVKKLGASAVLSEDVNVKKAFENTIICKNIRKCEAEISNILYGNQLSGMKLVGITGTKGKTTTLHILSEILSSCNIDTISIGTNGIYRNGVKYAPDNSDNTTPSAPIIYKTLADASKLGVKAALIEVSSQALITYRVHKIPFDVCVFTGFSPDHIGKSEHKDALAYLNAKKRLFSLSPSALAVVNSNSKFVDYLTYGSERVIKVGGSGADIKVEIQNKNLFSVDFLLREVLFNLSMGGEYNAYNAALAITVANEVFGIKYEDMRSAIACVSVSGRREMYFVDGKLVVIDFAHNASSFEALIGSIREFVSGKIIVVFGSVGKRSLARRRELAEISEALADFSYITSDDPGIEPATDICHKIYSFYKNKERAKIIVDRKEAIIDAVKTASHGDAVLLLGKGHDNCQRVGSEKVYFSERDIILTLGAKPYVKQKL